MLSTTVAFCSAMVPAVATSPARSEGGSRPRCRAAGVRKLCSMQRASKRKGCQRHPLLVQLRQTLHMRLPVMMVQCLDLFGPVLPDTRRNGLALQTLKLLGVVSLNL